MARDQGTMARRRQVRDSPRTLSGEQTRAPYSSAAEAAAETAVAREAKRHSDTGRDAENSSHGQVEYYSTVGSSPLGGSMSSGASALVFAVETPVVPLRQGRGPAGEAGASTPFFTPGVASTASVARQFHQASVLRRISGGRLSSDPEQAGFQDQQRGSPRQPQQSQGGCASEVPVAPSRARYAAESSAEVRAPAMVDMSPQRASSLAEQEEASSGDADPRMPLPASQPKRQAPLSPSAVFKPRGQLPRTPMAFTGGSGGAHTTGAPLPSASSDSSNSSSSSAAAAAARWGLPSSPARPEVQDRLITHRQPHQVLVVHSPTVARAGSSELSRSRSAKEALRKSLELPQEPSPPPSPGLELVCSQQDQRQHPGRASAEQPQQYAAPETAIVRTVSETIKHHYTHLKIGSLLPCTPARASSSAPEKGTASLAGSDRQPADIAVAALASPPESVSDLSTGRSLEESFGELREASRPWPSDIGVRMEEALLLGERAIGERDSARADLDKLRAQLQDATAKLDRQEQLALDLAVERDAALAATAKAQAAQQVAEERATHAQENSRPEVEALVKKQQVEYKAITEELLAMEREKATMRRSMLVAQQQLTTAQSEAADARGANSKALANAEDAVLQLQRRLTEQASTLAVGALELDELRESATRAARREEADGRTIAQLEADKAQLVAGCEEDKVELKKLRAAVTAAAAIAADRERLRGVVTQCQAEIAKQGQQIMTLRKQLDSERSAREAIELTNVQLLSDMEKTRAPASGTAVANSSREHSDAICTTSFHDAAESGEQEGAQHEASARMPHLRLSVEDAEEQLRTARAAERVHELQRKNDAAEAEASSLFSSEVWKAKQTFVMSPASRQLLQESTRGKLPPFEERQREFQVRNGEWRAEQKLQAEEAELAELRAVPKIPAASEALAARARKRDQHVQGHKEQPDAKPAQASASDAAGDRPVPEADAPAAPTNTESVRVEDVCLDTCNANNESAPANARLDTSAAPDEPLLDLYRERLYLALQESGSAATLDDLVRSPPDGTSVVSVVPSDDQFDDRAEQLMMEMSHVEEMLVAAAVAEIEVESHTEAQVENEPGNDDHAAAEIAVGAAGMAPEGPVESDPTPNPNDATDIPVENSCATLKQLDELTAQMEALDSIPCEPPVKLRSVVRETAQTANALNALRPSVAGQEAECAEQIELGTPDAVADGESAPRVASAASAASPGSAQQPDADSDTVWLHELPDDLQDDTMAELPDIPNSPGLNARDGTENAAMAAMRTASVGEEMTVWEEAEDEKWQQLVGSPALQSPSVDAPQRGSARSAGKHVTVEDSPGFHCCRNDGLDVTSATDSTMDNTFCTAISDEGGGADLADVANNTCRGEVSRASLDKTADPDDAAQTLAERAEESSMLSTSADLSDLAESLSADLLAAAAGQSTSQEALGSPQCADETFASAIGDVCLSTLTSPAPASEPDPEPDVQLEPEPEPHQVQRYQIASPESDQNSSSASALDESAAGAGGGAGGDIGSYLPSKYLSYSPDNASSGSAEVTGQPTPDASPTPHHPPESPSAGQLMLDVVCPEGVGPGQLLRVRVPSAELTARQSRNGSDVSPLARTASLEVRSPPLSASTLSSFVH